MFSQLMSAGVKLGIIYAQYHVILEANRDVLTAIPVCLCIGKIL